MKTAGTRPRFVADAMLGRLARYLRFLGYDTVYDVRTEDRELVEQAREEGRVLLTRDERLIRELRPPRGFLLRGDDPLDQLRQVVRGLPLDVVVPTLERCSVCNSPLVPAPEDLARRAPEAVRRRTRTFVHCSSCDRLYWEGSHVSRLRERLRRALETVPERRTPTGA